jgi:hypothetical protein
LSFHVQMIDLDRDSIHVSYKSRGAGEDRQRGLA